jgi:hypothetical protein
LSYSSQHSLFQITINIKKVCSITEFIGTLEVNINHSSCMGQTLEIVINSYLGETNVSVGYLVYFVIFFTTQELALGL